MTTRAKAKVETAVQIVERRILASLRNCQFHNINDLRRAVHEKLIAINQAPFSKLAGSRDEVFKRHEKPRLRPLPMHHFVIGEWKKAKVDIDYHIQVDRHFYSVSYVYIGETVDVRLSTKTVEIFRNSCRIASHKRSFQPGKATTDPAHRPPQHNAVIQQNLGDLLSQAKALGPHIHQAAEHIVANFTRCEMAFRSIRGLTRLAQRYGKERLEHACARALQCEICRYKTIKNMLANNREKQPQSVATVIEHRNIRGSGYYRSYEKRLQPTPSQEGPKC